MLYTNQINLKKVQKNYSTALQRKISLQAYSEKYDCNFPITDIKFLIDPSNPNTLKIGLISNPDSNTPANLFELIEHLNDLKVRGIYKTTFHMLYDGKFTCEIESLLKEQSDWYFISCDNSFDSCLAVNSGKGSSFSKENGFIPGEITPFEDDGEQEQESSNINEHQIQATIYLIEWLADFYETEETPEILNEALRITHMLGAIGNINDKHHGDIIKEYLVNKIGDLEHCISTNSTLAHSFSYNPILQEAEYIYDNFDDIFNLQN